MKTYLKDRRLRTVIILLAFFYYIFLGTEYLFDNMMAYMVDEPAVVMAQNEILGASVIGFFVYPVMVKYTQKKYLRELALFVMGVVSVICIFLIEQHTDESLVLTAGCILFLIFGIIGSGTHDLFAKRVGHTDYLGKMIGIAYAAGIFLQFLNHNLVGNDQLEAVVLSMSVMIWLCMLIKESQNMAALDDQAEIQKYRHHYEIRNTKYAAIALIAVVVLMTCIFSSLDNAVTLVHVSGKVDIGQLPRLLLAISGVCAGALFDLANRKYMHYMMYCVTLLSTICFVMLYFGGSFLMGLFTFYVSAGFFAVYFTTSFMELSFYMKHQSLWAGLGRAVNNLCAVVISLLSVTILSVQSEWVILMSAIVLFVAIGVSVYVCSGQMMPGIQTEVLVESDDEKFSRFADTYKLTQKEQQVFKILIESDKNVQDIADELFISRAALYRHIGNLNRKTETGTRIGLIQFYYRWH